MHRPARLSCQSNRTAAASASTPEMIELTFQPPRRLNLSIPPPLNRPGKPLSWLAPDVEAEPPSGAGESGSIARKDI